MLFFWCGWRDGTRRSRDGSQYPDDGPLLGCDDSQIADDGTFRGNDGSQISVDGTLRGCDGPITSKIELKASRFGLAAGRALNNLFR